MTRKQLQYEKLHRANTYSERRQPTTCQYSAALGSASSKHGTSQDHGIFPKQAEFHLKLVSLETFSISACLHHCYTAVLNPLAIILEQCLEMAILAYEAVQHQVLNVANYTAQQGQMTRNILLSVLMNRSIKSYNLL